MRTPESFQTPTSEVHFVVTSIDGPSPWAGMQQTYPSEPQQAPRRTGTSPLPTASQANLRFQQVTSGISGGSFLFTSVLSLVTHQPVFATLYGLGAVGFFGINRLVTRKLHVNERRNVPTDQIN